MNVTVFGIGYVGLVQGTVLASVGHQVVCVDVDGDKVNALKQGISPLFEPGLTPMIEENYASGRLQFTTDMEIAVEHGELQFIAVGTPPDEDGTADLKHVLSVAETIATYMQSSKVVVNKSTVPVGTADKVKQVIAAKLSERNKQLPFQVVSNPEFLKEGAAVNDCLRPDRIIIGTEDSEAEELMRELYAPFNRNHDKIIIMDVRSAELTKYAANCMLATKISFMNEMANLAEQLGADIESVRHGIGSDPRIGYQFIYPGCGYGGSCFPKDIQALVRTANNVGYQPSLLEAVEKVNYQQKHKLFEYLSSHFEGELKGKVIAIWGLSFKPNTDDMREASSRVLMESLWESGAIIQAYDPEAMDECQRIYGQRDDLVLTGTKEIALKGADALVICTEWSQFRAPDFELIIRSLSEKLIIDGRNMYNPKIMEKKGIIYYGVGRGRSIREPN
ncbi:UDP-glucose dehydrogenase family protein [Aliikangiella sp. IMCC44359]|uniref:UDP-glucose dehydrogenase family protein n=1 Tax=Aliikangiella sp. IMCC44359 TaxID=3459125 RepID=UPI00403AB28C